MNHNVLVWLSKRKFQKYTRNVRFRVWVLKSGKSSIIFGLKTVIFKTAFCFQFSIQNVRFGSVLAKLYNQVPSLSLSSWRTLLSCRKLGQVGCYDVLNVRQKSAAEKSTVNQCTADYCLMFKTSYHPIHLNFQPRKSPEFCFTKWSKEGT